MLFKCYKSRNSDSMMNNNMGKGYRVALDVNLAHRKGIFATSLSQLKEKCIERFKLNLKADNLNLFLEDGTEIEDDEYFQQVQAQSFIVAEVNGKIRSRPTLTPENVFDQFLSLVRWSGGTSEVYQEVVELLKEDFTSKYLSMSEHVKTFTEDRSKFSSKEQDPDWFHDINTVAKTKEEFMYRNCQSRIRGYLSRAEQQLKESGHTISKKENMKIKKGEEDKIHLQELIAQVLQQFREKLRESKYHGEYFDRSALENQRICDETGLFKCEGKYTDDNCTYSGDIKTAHLINPYSSREARILFSTWNLDHIIERSRSIVPSLVEASKLVLKSKKKNKINVEYFYSLMFTRTNLRLVHIVCHDKQEHCSAKCDQKLYLK